MQLGEKIQISRKKKGMSQEDLANLLNVSRQAVQKWENGSSTPEINKLIEISNAFDVSLDWLLKDVPNKVKDKESDEPSVDEPKEKPNKTKEVQKSRNNYYVIKVFLIIGIILTPITIGIPIMRYPNMDTWILPLVIAIMYGIELLFGLSTLNALKIGKTKREIIGYGILAIGCISPIAGIIMLASKDPFHPMKERFIDKRISWYRSSVFGYLSGIIIIALSAILLLIRTTVADDRFLFLYLYLFIEFNLLVLN